jgi:hypothetical protein
MILFFEGTLRTRSIVIPTSFFVDISLSHYCALASCKLQIAKYLSRPDALTTIMESSRSSLLARSQNNDYRFSGSSSCICIELSSCECILYARYKLQVASRRVSYSRASGNVFGSGAQTILLACYSHLLTIIAISAIAIY